MDIQYTQEQNKFRAEVRNWLADNLPKKRLKSFDTKEGFEEHREWERVLFKDRWGNVNWPKEYGGRGLDLTSWLIFEEEYYGADGPLRVSQNGIFLLAPTIMEYGTEAQKARFLPPMASGDEIWAQAWSEPGAGSDMAAIRTKAVRDGDHYIVSGQKTWSSRAVFADWCFALVRTEEGSERHRGLSKLLIPLDSPGLTIRPIAQLDGHPGFAEIFFDNVNVPLENRIGEDGQGWHVAMATAGFERGLLLRSPARFQQPARRLVQLYRDNKASADRDPSIGAAVAKCWSDAEAYALSAYNTVGRVNNGEKIGAESSLNKIFWSELDLLIFQTAMNILGTTGELLNSASLVKEQAYWLDGFLFAQAGPIYAGTNEIQRNIVAERVLGLPKK